MKYKNEKIPTAKDLAQYLGVSVNSVYHYKKEKRLLLLLGLKLKKEIDKRERECKS